MKKTIFLFLSLLTLLGTTNSAFAENLTSRYMLLLQTKLSFSGFVEVTDVVESREGHMVTFEVTSYGDTRGNWCYIVDFELVECREDWFYE